ncbi:MULTISPECIES: hypothetical protein [unclassified Mesorhizobium]|uniref:hypothetical protein n=1 Tax=unclassified Mesorhizobium TaxID=325217 RepID=UPI0013E06FB1|nr:MULTISPECIES: hypothetical protein [unclassified Mesorhizobium]
MTYTQTDKPLRVLVACEYSGTVRRAFAARGHDAWSCDLLPSADRSNKHLIGDARDFLNDGWDLLMVAHPPCTRLCNSGVRWLSEPPGKLTAEHYSAVEIAAYKTMSRDERLAFMWRKLDEGAELFSAFWNSPIERVCIENPVMHQHAKDRIRNYAPFAQSVQPWQYGEPESKRTCLWMRGLDPLVPTYRTWDECRDALGLPSDAKPEQRVHSVSPGPARWAERSKFFDGIANAMADQWGKLPAAPFLYREAA